MPHFDLFSKLLKINPAAGQFITIGLMVLAAAAMITGMRGGGSDTLALTATYIIGFSIVVRILMHLPGLVIRLIGWVLTIAFCIWLSAFLAQTLTGGKISWLAPPQCLVFPLSNACAITWDTTTETVETATLSNDPGTGTATDPAQPSEAHPPVANVMVHFAGAIPRESVVSFSEELARDGWPVENADRGGERTGKSAGLNEVRFFHAEDRAAAEALALRSASITPAGHTLAVRDLTDTRFSGEGKTGVLEVWISN